MLHKLMGYLNENNFKITMNEKMVYIKEFNKVENFTDNKIILTTKENNVIIMGKQLVIKKMINSEILITGTIKKVEFGGINE